MKWMKNRMCAIVDFIFAKRLQTVLNTMTSDQKTRLQKLKPLVRWILTERSLAPTRLELSVKFRGMKCCGS